MKSLLFACAACVVALPAVAQDTAASTETTAVTEPGVSSEYIRAYDVAMARISQTLSHETVAHLSLLAYSAAAAGLCPDLALDESAVYGALVASTHDALDGATKDEAQQHKDFALIAFGVLTGLMLEKAVKEEEAFCTEAVEYTQSVGADSFLQQVSTAVPYSAGE